MFSFCYILTFVLCFTFFHPRTFFCLLPVPSLPSWRGHGPKLGNHWNRLLHSRGSRSYSEEGHWRFLVPTRSQCGQTGKLLLFPCCCYSLEFPGFCLPGQEVQIREIVKNCSHGGRGPRAVFNKFGQFSNYKLSEGCVKEFGLSRNASLTGVTKDNLHLTKSFAETRIGNASFFLTAKGEMRSD